MRPAAPTVGHPPGRAASLRLLQRLVEHAGWRGEARALANAAPHLSERLTPEDHIATLENLGLPLFVAETRLGRLTADDCPCLFIAQNGAVMSVLARTGDMMLVMESGDGKPARRAAPGARRGPRGVMVKVLADGGDGGPRPPAALGDMLTGFRGALVSLLAASFFTNLMAFATPVLIMVIYDRVIPTDAVDLIWSLALAMGLIFATDAALRALRARVAAHLGVRVERSLGLALFRKLTALPLAQVEKSGAHDQLARLKQFEGLRDIFTGQIFSTFLDLPFTLLFLGVVFALSPAIGVMLIGVAAAFGLAGLVAAPAQRRLNAAAAAAKTAHQKLLFEITSHQRAIRRLGAETAWADRAGRLAERSARQARRAKRWQMIAQAFGQSLMMAAGVGVIAIGAEQALAGDLSFGGLIAVMALVWRFLGPVQALYANASRIQSFAQSRRQVDRVLALDEEFVRGASVSRMKTFSGRLALVNATCRFDAASDPALAGVSISVGRGELVMIAGNSGAGKSTLLNLVTRLVSPVAGGVRLDGVDYRQIAADELRRAVAHDLQEPAFFHGTLRQNFRLSDPTLSDEAIAAALDCLDLAREVEALPEGLDTRLTGAVQARMSRSVLRGLSLARCLARDAPIYLFDEPCMGLDSDREHAFLRVLQAMKGRKTTLMVTNRPSHFELADRLILLDRGRVLVNDKGPAARKKISALQEQVLDR